MAKIFISYSHWDDAFVSRLADDLIDAGHIIWIDKYDLRASENWIDATQKGLDECDVMLLVVSEHSMGSAGVKSEWWYFLQQKKPVIPVMLRHVELPFLLNHVQYVDFSDYDSAFERLQSALQQMYPTLAADDSETFTRQGQRLEKALDAELPRLPPRQDSASHDTASFPITAILTGMDSLTPTALSTQISPYLQAIIDLEGVIADLQDREFVEPRLRGMAQNSPIGVNIEGGDAAIDAITEYVDPHKRQHAKKMRELEEAQAQVGIDEAQARVAQLGQTTPTDEEQALRIRRQRLEIERMEWELKKERITLAMQIVDHYAACLEESARVAYTMRVLEALNVFIPSPIELELPRRPESLPD